MTNDELKKKIVEIMSKVWEEPVPCTAERKFECISDALIAAGIGDVKESENKATAAELVARVSASTAIEKIAEWKHRAEVAERALKNVCEDRVFTGCRCCSYKELCEKEHRFELDEDCTESAEFCKDQYMKQAEKELAEEGKE